VNLLRSNSRWNGRAANQCARRKDCRCGPPFTTTLGAPLTRPVQYLRRSRTRCH
jgi:hypothetical protein